MKQIFSKLRRHAKTDYRLLILCNFIANLLVSAFSFLIWSSTVQKTFPPGGDSMKQVMMVFCIAIFGCLVFTVYAALLFFRYKSREIGIFMALGAGKRSLAGQLFRELFVSMSVPALTASYWVRCSPWGSGRSSGFFSRIRKAPYFLSLRSA